MFRMPYEDDKRWARILIQLERTRIAAVQAPPPIDYHVSPPPAESLGSVRPRQEARRAIFLPNSRHPAGAAVVVLDKGGNVIAQKEWRNGQEVTNDHQAS